MDAFKIYRCKDDSSSIMVPTIMSLDMWQLFAHLLKFYVGEDNTETLSYEIKRNEDLIIFVTLRGSTFL